MALQFAINDCGDLWTSAGRNCLQYGRVRVEGDIGKLCEKFFDSCGKNRDLASESLGGNRHLKACWDALESNVLNSQRRSLWYETNSSRFTGASPIIGSFERSVLLTFVMVDEVVRAREQRSKPKGSVRRFLCNDY